ncbi:hypothetical protein ACA910_018011 [Epithemia clementina (nom. ined.)]
MPSASWQPFWPTALVHAWQSWTRSSSTLSSMSSSPTTSSLTTAVPSVPTPVQDLKSFVAHERAVAGEQKYQLLTKHHNHNHNHNHPNPHDPNHHLDNNDDQHDNDHDHDVVTTTKNRLHHTPPHELPPTEQFHRYAVAHCASASSYELAVHNLRLQLADDEIPEAVREKLLTRILVRGLSQKNSLQDASEQKNGQASSYLAFWSTTYNPIGNQNHHNPNHHDLDEYSLDATTTTSTTTTTTTTNIHHKNARLYETCVLVAGVTIQAAEMVAEYRRETKTVVVGTEPCHCGFWYCEVCPVWDVQTTLTPIFQRHALSSSQQQELHSILTLQALQAAERMLATSSSSSSSSSNHPEEWYDYDSSTHHRHDYQQRQQPQRAEHHHLHLEEIRNLSWKKPIQSSLEHHTHSHSHHKKKPARPQPRPTKHEF